MKTGFFIIFFSVVLVLAMNSANRPSYRHYQYMRIERRGGGQINFSVLPCENQKDVRIKLLSFNFRDTALTFVLKQNEGNCKAIRMFYQTLTQKNKPGGSFQQSKLLTGTWVFVYFGRDKSETEFTNSPQRELLLQLEQIVRKQIHEKE